MGGGGNLTIAARVGDGASRWGSEVGTAPI